MSDATTTVLDVLKKQMKERRIDRVYSFSEFLENVANRPEIMFRSIHQYVRDMYFHYVVKLPEEDPHDTEAIGYDNYDTSQLFVEGVDEPYFADTVMANRLAQMMKSLPMNNSQNLVYEITGPAGCGKSSCVNNVLRGLERYSLLEAGERPEIVWVLDKHVITKHSTENKTQREEDIAINTQIIPCPNHCHPIYIIPTEQRQAVIENVAGKDFLAKVLSHKEYSWLLKNESCPFCDSMINALLMKKVSPDEIFNMVNVRQFVMSRKHGAGIAVYNPGDKGNLRDTIPNGVQQKWLDTVFGSSDLVRLASPGYSDTNQGVLLISDIKGLNSLRFIDLHGILSERRVRDGRGEVVIDTLYMATSNPDDIEVGKPTAQHNPDDVKLNDASFNDRRVVLQQGYILEYETELKILKYHKGDNIKDYFYPGVFDCFLKLIVAPRLSEHSETIDEWIKDKKPYLSFCDENLTLLKMELYAGRIPEWLEKQDRLSLTASVRRRLINESKKEGLKKTMSGRASLKVFQKLIDSRQEGKGRITIQALKKFVKEKGGLEFSKLPANFVDSVAKYYNYEVVQTLRKALFEFNLPEIDRLIHNYLFGLNFTVGSYEKCPYTLDNLEIDEKFFSKVEEVIWSDLSKERRNSNRLKVQERFVREERESGEVRKTKVYQEILREYEYELRMNILDPLGKNPNYRTAFKDWGKESFETFDVKIKEDVAKIIKFLVTYSGYTVEEAINTCTYVIDENLIFKFKQV